MTFLHYLGFLVLCVDVFTLCNRIDERPRKRVNR